MAEKKTFKDSTEKKQTLEKLIEKPIQEKKKRFFRDTHFRKKIIFFTVVIAGLVYLFSGIPLPTSLGQKEPVSTQIFDRSGKLIYEIFADKKRDPIKLSDLPPYVGNATVSIEDKDFYKHSAFSPTGIIRAAYSTVFKGDLQGGSTIEQQYVKNAFLTQDRTIKRKIQELFLAMIIESIYTKQQILEAYLNQVPYGGDAYGIESASQQYFNKSAKDLDLAQAALLAGLTQAPTYYSPFGAHPELAKQRQIEVLKSMVTNKYITEAQADAAEAEPLIYAEPSQIQAPHFALWIKDQLVQQYGEQMVNEGGLRVYTTLDLDLQNFAQQTVATEVGKLVNQNVKNGAVIVTRPADGEILAMVGSKDYFDAKNDGNVNVIFADRQPGSSIKPFNYALAIRDRKITPATILADVPTCFDVAGQQPYCPVNYDGQFHGGEAVRFALGNSFNIPAVRVLALNGLNNFINFATSVGITTFTDPSKYGLSLTLGGGEVTPYDMAEAYGTLANGGIKEPLVAITKITDWKGNVLEDNKLDDLTGNRVVPQDVSFLISQILLDNNARAQEFGTSSYLVVSGHPEVSVKTGTTNDRRDNWTDGYTGQIAAVVWVGNNDNTPMNGSVSGITGASPIFNKVIAYALNKSEKGFYNKSDDGHAWPTQPSDVKGMTICADTGLAPTSGDPNNPGCPARFDYFIDGTQPQAIPTMTQNLTVYKDTHMIASSSATPDQVQQEQHPIVQDPLGTILCLDCPLPTYNVTINYPIFGVSDNSKFTPTPIATPTPSGQ
ncbi:MAG TPA: transglycosylase domain-containing protein [Patescibacteria group bacterium]|nr:transglycosylase domain-containing protein [Patescibacteria group bacterium]